MQIFILMIYCPLECKRKYTLIEHYNTTIPKTEHRYTLKKLVIAIKLQQTNLLYLLEKKLQIE